MTTEAEREAAAIVKELASVSDITGPKMTPERRDRILSCAKATVRKPEAHRNRHDETGDPDGLRRVR